MAYFDSLPEEIQVEILVHLDYLALLRSTSTCRSLYKTRNESLELQYNIELAIDGLEHAGSLNSHVELLARLRDLRAGWQALSWKRLTKLSVGNSDDCNAYELVAGVFAVSDGELLKINWLPSATVDGHTLERQSLGFSIRDFAIDPTQDVIFILEDDNIPISFTQGRDVRIHIKTVSTNECHPLAQQDILAFNIAPDPDYGNGIPNLTLQIAYDIVALFIGKVEPQYHSRVLIWHWREGALLYNSDQSTPSLPNDIYDFSLLSRDSFVVTSTHDDGCLLLYSFSPSTPLPSPPTLTSALHLPAIGRTRRIRKFTIHSGPSSAYPPDNSFFSTSADSQIHVFTVYYTTEDDSTGLPCYSLFVHNRTLLKYIHLYKSDPGGAELFVQWENWGIMNTRFIPNRSPTLWSRYVHGQRVVCSSSGHDFIDVLDFNIRDDFSTPGPYARCYMRSDPSYIEASSLFKDKVITRLPYRVLTRNMGKNFYACMIEQEHLIGVEIDHDDVMNLHVYSF